VHRFKKCRINYFSGISMSQNPSEAGIFHSDLSFIPRALCNEKALFVLLATSLLAIALAFLGQTLADPVSFVTILLSFLILLVVLPAGTSIAGLLLMDQARKQTPRPLRKAVSDGIPAFLRIFSIALLGIALMAIFILFLGVVLFVCKLPAVGPVLYAVLFPVLLISGSLLYLGLTAGLSMACPAVWSGSTVRETLETLRRIATNRSPELLVNLLLLAVLITLAELIFIGIVFAGSLPVMAMSATILGTVPSITLSSSATGGYALAGAFGLMTVLALVLTALAAMTMMGLNLIYLRITKDLPLTEAMEHGRFSASYGSTDKKEPTLPPFPQATATGNMGSSPSSGPQDILASLLTGTPPAATFAEFAENAKTALICPRCKATTQPGDRFCGECGGSVPG
jgi:hypothetical protein